MPIHFDEPFWIGDRYFSLDDIALIQNTLRRFRRLRRPELAATLCENLPWTTTTGAPRLAACRKLLDAIEAAQWMPVSPKRPPRRGRPSADHQGDPIPGIAIGLSPVI